MPLCDDQPPPSAQSASRAASSKNASVSILVPRRRDAAVSTRANAASSLRTGTPAAADHRVSSSSSTSMMQHGHAPSPEEHQPTNPATSSARVNPSRSASSAITAPTPRTFFDPWNSSSTGHQRAENRLSGSTSWRSSRNLKLSEQYRGGLSGGRRVADTAGAGSEEFGKDGRKFNGGWEKGASGLRTGGQKSLPEVWGARKASSTAKKSSQEEVSSKHVDPQDDDPADCLEEHGSSDTDPKATSEPTENQIFQGLCFYLNGSTAPLISDHKLKHLLSAHGADYSIALGRRTVSHVILGTTCGGGLAGSKLQKEISRRGGKSVKFITADWVLSSIAASKRLPESHFAPLKLAPKGQKSVFPNLASAQPPAG